MNCRIILLYLVFLCSPLLSWSQVFIENKGQWPEQVLYRAEIPQGKIYLEQGGITYDIRDAEHFHEVSHAHERGEAYDEAIAHHAYKLLFMDEVVEHTGQDVEPCRYSYFQGQDEEKWGSDARGYRQVTLKSVAEGVDMRCYFQHGKFKYDLIVHPGTHPSQLQFKYVGIEVSLDKGSIRLKTAFDDILESPPKCYQDVDGVRIVVPSTYRLEDDILGFHLGDYDPDLTLVIDPEVVFSSYSGSVANNFGYTATFDQSGFLYSGSTIFDNGYPTTPGAYWATFNGGNVDIAISKWDTTGTFMIYSTYIGGDADELPHSIIVNAQDELYVFGTTGSNDYPVTSEAYDLSFTGADFSLSGIGGLGVGFVDGSDLFVSKLSFNGTELLASTYIGENGMDGLNRQTATTHNYADEVRGEIELDASGNVIIASCTGRFGDGPISFPTSAGALHENFIGGDQDGVLFSMDPNLENLLWSTFIGGGSDDAAFSVTVNSANQVIVAGGTNSTDLITSADAINPNYLGGSTDAWVTVLDANGQNVIHSTYWGTAVRDQAYMVELDNSDNIHLFGQTHNGDALIINAAYSNANSGQFISKLTPELNAVIWSTAFGNGNGIPNISPTAFLVDICDRIYLSGWGGPTGPNDLTTVGLPVTSDAVQSETVSGDFYLMALSDDASELVYGSFYGGDQSNEHVDGGTSRFDRKGKVYQAVCAGCQNNSDFPIFPSNALSSDNGSGGCNLGVLKMDFDLPVVIADFFYDPICLPDTASFINTSEGGLSFHWDFGDNTSSDDYQPNHVYEEPGLYTVTLITNDPLSCNLADTTSIDIFIFDPSGAVLNDTTVCQGQSVELGFESLPVPGLSYSWTNGNLLSNPNISNPIATVTESTQFTLTIDNDICPSTATQTVFIQEIGLETSSDTLICEGATLTLSATTFGIADDYIWSTSPDFSDVLSTDSTLTVSPLFETTYYVQASDDCVTTGSVTVGLYSDAFSIGTSQYVCAGDTASVFFTSSTPLDGLDIIWSPAAPIISGQGSDQIDVITSNELWMSAMVINEGDCIWTDSVLVEISPLSFIEVEATATPSLIPLGGQSQLMAQPDGYDYQWTPDIGLNSSLIQNPTSSPPGSTTYTVSITDENLNGACLRSDTVTVRVFEFDCAFPTTFIPNAFSPNNDGQNDILYVRSDYIARFELKIYDRWGEIVFQTDDQSEGWDGRFRGRALEPDVYVYHLDIICIDGQENFEKGNITLIR